MFAGLLAAPVATRVQFPPPATAGPQVDPRLVRLHEFFGQNACPVSKFATDFIEAADSHELDWRLLPSISIIESGGGKEYRNNNVFGWDNCKRRFPSVKAGIHIVAERLANSKLYRDKDTDEILRTYNPRLEYTRRVKAVMNTIGSADLGAANSLN